MKKLLIGSVIAVLCMGASVVYADDTHHPEQGSAPATPGKTVLPKQPAAPEKSRGSTGGSSVTGAQIGKAQERMKQAQVLMAKILEAKDPAERRKLMQEHTQAMRDTMGMMREMKMDMMGSGMDMAMMSKDHGPAKSGGMMDMHQMMEERMGMMQMMMEQMLERQEVLMQDGK